MLKTFLAFGMVEARRSAFQRIYLLVTRMLYHTQR